MTEDRAGPGKEKNIFVVQIHLCLMCWHPSEGLKGMLI